MPIDKFNSTVNLELWPTAPVLRSTSGAMQLGVPTSEWARHRWCCRAFLLSSGFKRSVQRQLVGSSHSLLKSMLSCLTWSPAEITQHRTYYSIHFTLEVVGLQRSISMLSPQEQLSYSFSIILLQITVQMRIFKGDTQSF